MGVDYSRVPSGVVVGKDGDLLHLYTLQGAHMLTLHAETAESIAEFVNGQGVYIPRDWQSANVDNRTWGRYTSHGNPALVYLRTYIESTSYPMLRTQTLLMLRGYFGKERSNIWNLVPDDQVQHAIKVMRKIVGDDDFYRTIHWLPTED